MLKDCVARIKNKLLAVDKSQFNFIKQKLI